MLTKEEGIEDLFRKFLNKTLTKKELSEFTEWVNSSPDNKQFCINALKFQKIETQLYFLKYIDKEYAWYNISEKIHAHRRSLIRKRYYMVAVSAIAFIFILLIQSGYISLNKPSLPEQFPNMGKEQAILLLNNGGEVRLTKNDLKQELGNLRICAEKGVLNYELINKDSLGIDSPGNKDNLIVVPLGAEYRIMLPDGTKVWLNAGSSFRFPTYFGKSRKVELSGEGYFDVAKDNEHPFILKVKGNTIKVLGTQFNVSAYDNEPMITTLTEGRVHLSSKKDEDILYSGQQAIINNNNNIYKMDVNPSSFSSWKNGIFEFDNMPLHYIVAQLSRWYNIEMSFGSDKASEIRFTGVIFRKQSLGQSMEAIQKISKVSFKKKGDNVVVDYKDKGERI